MISSVEGLYQIPMLPLSSNIVCFFFQKKDQQNSNKRNDNLGKEGIMKRTKLLRRHHSMRKKDSVKKGSEPKT